MAGLVDGQIVPRLAPSAPEIFTVTLSVSVKTVIYISSPELSLRSWPTSEAAKKPAEAVTVVPARVKVIAPEARLTAVLAVPMAQYLKRLHQETAATLFRP